MTTLRVLVTEPIADASPAPWASYDASGACTATGKDVPSRWPPADRIELVIAARHVRLACVTLPPLPPQRVAGAAAFALEDRVAGPLDEQCLAASPRQRDGRVVVAIVARGLMKALRARMASAPLSRVARIVTEPDLADSGSGLRWCAAEDRAASDGFVRLGDGSAVPVGAPLPDGALPAELALVLANAGRDGKRATAVRVDAAIDDDALARWQRDTGVPFVRGAPWRWHAAPASAFAAAANLLHGEFALPDAVPAIRGHRWFVPALWLAAAALLLHVGASVGEWAWWRIDAWRTAKEWRALATTAGATVSDADSPQAARVALFKRYGQLRHAGGLSAPSDALPLLARVAPALATLPPGTLKGATYADGHWTIDLRPTEESALRNLEARLKQAGTPPIIATTPAGTRLRVGVDG